MAVIELINPAIPVIDNNRTVLGVPLTGPSVAPVHKQDFGYELPDPTTDTAAIIATLNNRYNDRFYNQIMIDGGSA